MDAFSRTQELDELSKAAVVDAGVARCSALGVAVRAGGQWRAEVGAAGDVGPGQEATETTPFDLASVSKSFVACAFARLWKQGALAPTSALGRLVPECVGTRSERRSLALLLSHRAGLEAHRRLFAPIERGRPIDRVTALRTAGDAERPALEPGEPPPLYSDLGYLLAGEALARAAKRALDELVQEEVAAPLRLSVGSARQWARREPEFLVRVAPTENVAFRGGTLVGVVHDENAWAFAGHGLAGQAGLFGTVLDVLSFGMKLLDALSGRDAHWLDTESLRYLVAARPGGTLRLGFDGKSGEQSAAGPGASALTFGHLGFTGTSFWCDPVAEAVTVLLTNRVYPTRENLRIRSCRPIVHEALFERARALRVEGEIDQNPSRSVGRVRNS